MLSIKFRHLLKLLKFILLAGILFVFIPGFSQSSVWYFGQNAGISFNAAGVPMALQNGNMNTPEGCACITNSNGQIANYSNGHKLWNGLGNMISSDLNGNKNAIQSAVFLPKPQDKDTVYLFTLDADVGQNGLCYSVIVNQNIVSGKKNINLAHNVTERMCVVQHCNNQDAWLIVHGWNNSLFYAYKIDGEGVDTVPVVSNIGSIHSGNLLNATGYMKADQLGDRLAVAKMGSGTVELFHFDNVNGIVSNAIELTGLGAAYGVEFNESGSILYVSTASGNLSNFNLSNWNSTDIQNSRQIIQPSGSLLGALQLGPNNTIYVARDNAYYVGRISAPDNMGTACSYTSDFLFLDGNKCEAGLPPFVEYSHSFIPYANVSCVGDSSFFSVLGDNIRIDSLLWDFGDLNATNDISTHLTSSYVYPTKGTYHCNLFVYHCDVVDTFKIIAEVLDIPEVDLGSDTSICENTTLVLDAKVSGSATYLWQDGSTKSGIKVKKTGSYWVQVNTVCGLASDTILISNIWEAPKFYLPNDTILCKGDSIVLDGGENMIQYLWQNKSGSRYYTVKDSGMIHLAVIDSNSCHGDDYLFISMDSVPSSNLGNDTTICFGNTLILDAGNADRYLWQNYIGGQYYRVSQTGTYAVQLSNRCGATDDSIDVIVDDCLQNIAIPNAFTPNGDLLNDYFLAKAENISSFEMHIYDKWGHELFYTNDLYQGWDGRDHGKEAMVGVYVYIIRYQNNYGESLTKRGFVNLIR
jgi:gliding motility-associated-like protein